MHWFGGIRIIPIADYECELGSADALLGKHDHWRLRRMDIRGSARSDPQQCHADKTTSHANQLTIDVELPHIHFALHLIAVASTKSRASSISCIKVGRSI